MILTAALNNALQAGQGQGGGGIYESVDVCDSVLFDDTNDALVLDDTNDRIIFEDCDCEKT